MPPPALDALVAQYNVSPKLAHSGNPAALALPPERLAHWAAEPRAWFKFVVAEPADVAEVLAIRQAHAIAPERNIPDARRPRQRSHPRPRAVARANLLRQPI